jgi:hypothetical protein
MAFTVEDFEDLLRLLEQHPDWRAQLRRQVLSDEVLQLPEIVGQLAGRVDQLGERVEQLAAAQRKTEELLDALTGQVATLADRIGTMADRLGSIEGDLLEWRFERYAPAYFSRLARRLRVVDRSALADVLDDAVDAGTLSEPEREDALRADLVLSGRDREEGTDVYYVVEISAGVGVSDVQRASDRSQILAKLGRPAVPVVAGAWVTDHARHAAADLHVRQVEIGQRTAPSQN